jgi:hypothetical protein
VYEASAAFGSTEVIAAAIALATAAAIIAVVRQVSTV